MKKILVTLGIAVSIFLPGYAQQPVPTPRPADDDGVVVKISTDLIQIDVTVTDKNGRIVTGLGPDDFEIFENGEKQTISNTLFVSRSEGSATVDAAGNQSTSDRTSPGQTTTTLSAARRTIAVVVDDLNLSFQSVYYTRKALQKFVDDQMRPGDLVAIIRTGGGVGALQQFTSDKRILRAAIEKIRWNPFGGSMDALASVSQNDVDITDRFNREAELVAGGGRASKQRTPVLMRDGASEKRTSDANVPSNVAGQENSIYAQSSLGTVKYVMDGMRRMPGRKALMLFSDGIAIGNDSNKSGASAVFDYLQDVADAANRSSVVVYTFDTKGMRSMSITASDNTYEVIDGHRGQKERVRTREFKDSQDGLVYFATRTGGKALLNSDDLNGGIQRALDEQAGYYLLAYQPDAETFDADKRKFNKLEVKVRRPGLNVSYRSGFFSTTPDVKAPQLTVERQIANALTSPFAQNEIALNINALFADDAVDGPYIRSFLHIDARSLKFNDESGGWKKATFDVAAVTFGDNGAPVESKERKYTIKTRGATYEAMLERGFIYVLIMPLKKHGLYQYRVAVRDEGTGKIGSASQIIDVPDLSKRNLALSSLAVEDVSIATWQNITSGKVGTKPGQTQVASTLFYDTVLRQFKAATVLRYGFEVYNATAGESSLTHLETRARILQNDKVIVDGNLNKIDVSAQKDPKRLKISGAVTLPASLQPGDYVLQLSVLDRSANRRATQLLPFEIIK